MSEADRFEFALKHVRATDWEHFERLCSAFLADDFSNLRTIAGVGDAGRDAVLLPDDRPNVVLQYSIVERWKTKILDTVATLREKGVSFASLVYVTSEDIGTRSDELKRDLGKEGVILDIRDRRYFLDRLHQSGAKQQAAKDLIERVVTPLLPREELERSAPLTDPEMRAGLLYLELQLRDTDQGRNITKLTFDSLVLAALRGTTPESKRTRAGVAKYVQDSLPGQDADRIQGSVDGSLQRLKGNDRIVFTGSEDAFALHFKERERQGERSLELLAQKEEVNRELDGLLSGAAVELEMKFETEAASVLVDLTDRTLQRILCDQGNQFAEAVRSSEGTVHQRDVLAAAEDSVTEAGGALKATKLSRDEAVELIADVTSRAFVAPHGAVQKYLRELADSYTLLAFMREAPDVQKSVSHFFSRGTLVLDTTVLLPCFAETLLPPEDQRFTNLFRLAKEAGMELRATQGVVNELNAHLRLCLAYRHNRDNWDREVPRVYQEWLANNDGSGDFSAFIEQFRGRGAGGEEEIAFFLESALQVEAIDLSTRADFPSEEVRWRFTELWRPEKKRRREQADEEVDLLLKHDVEMYLGVLGRRRQEKSDVYGHETWWVTNDRSAFRMRRIARDDGIGLPSNPCMSPAFLSNLLALGPSRTKLGTNRLSLPVALDIQRGGWSVPGLSKLADEIRESHAGDPEWLIRRHIRDAMNAMKAERRDAAAQEAEAT